MFNIPESHKIPCNFPKTEIRVVRYDRFHLFLKTYNALGKLKEKIRTEHLRKYIRKLCIFFNVKGKLPSPGHLQPYCLHLYMYFFTFIE